MHNNIKPGQCWALDLVGLVVDHKQIYCCTLYSITLQYIHILLVVCLCPISDNTVEQIRHNNV